MPAHPCIGLVSAINNRTLVKRPSSRNHINRLNKQSKTSLISLLKYKVESLKRIESSYIFRDPQRITENKSLQLDYLSEKLELLNPINRLSQSKVDLEKIVKSLNVYYERYLFSKKNKYVLSINKLELLNPLSIMKKGYSVAKKNNIVIKSVDEINISDRIDILVNDGVIVTNVISKRKGDK